ncbi:DUF2231 domain-containing protein [Kamptonema formosum]|uniref:DUF2231 domain-containing protein n=1 Tax=Kamptonema formosum TaxID=331992 RepID=UPI00034527C5|nr:DUF2231 domain-containing protein [Oscillatoria sp. PCC 10802]
MPPLPLNNQNLPYPDPIHAIIVHFAIALVFFSFFCDAVGYLTRNHRLFEVSFWNLFVAALAIFLAVIFGQFEAGLAQPYEAAKPVLDLHTITGWSLSAILVAITAWRFAIRNRNPVKIPPAYLGAAAFLSCLVFFQTYLGTRLVWVYGLHVEPVVEATKRGLLQ